MRRVKIIGARVVTGRKGKNGGPVVEQTVQIVLTPKGA